MPLLILVSILATFLGLSGSTEISAQNFIPIEATWAILIFLGSLPIVYMVYALAVQRNSVSGIQEKTKTNRHRIDLLFHLTWFCSVIALMLGTEWTLFVQTFFIQSKSLQFLVASSPSFLVLFSFWWIGAWKESGQVVLSWTEAVCRFKVHVLTIVAPMLCILAIRDSSIIGTGSQSIVFQLAIFSIGIALLLILMPRMVGKILPTTSIKKTALGMDLMKIAGQTGTRLGDVRIWGTGDRLINALMVGMLPFSRSVFLSDRLIRTMELEEIQSVFLHELGHAHKQHLLQRLLAAGVPFAVLLMLGNLMGVEPSVAMASSMMFSLLGMALIARYLEYDADRFAVTKMGELGIDPAAYQAALQKILKDNPKADRHSWLHPRITERIERVQKISNAMVAAKVNQ